MEKCSTSQNWIEKSSRVTRTPKTIVSGEVLDAIVIEGQGCLRSRVFVPQPRAREKHYGRTPHDKKKNHRSQFTPAWPAHSLAISSIAA